MTQKDSHTHNGSATVTISQAAAFLGISRATLTDWINRGVFPYLELPSRGSQYHFRRVRREDLDTFLERYYRRSAVAAKPAKGHQDSPIKEANIIVL